jgi:hypothetical protein
MNYLEVLLSSKEPDYALRVAFPNAVYVLRFQWNMRSGWFFSLADAAGEPIISGRRLVNDFDLLRQCTDARRPPGELFLFDVTGNKERPTRTSLGEQHRMIYVY